MAMGLAKWQRMLARRRGDWRRQDVLDDFEKRSLEKFRDENIAIRYNQPGVVKMSKVLLEFVKPYEEFWTTNEEFRLLLMLAVTAWNMALLPEEKRASLLPDLWKGFPAELNEEGKRIILEMMKRKEQYFSECRRFVLNFDYNPSRQEDHLRVLSTLMD
jgi:hypothetical protein